MTHNTPIDPQIVDHVLAQYHITDPGALSIREMGRLVHTIEQQSGQQFVHMEMGIPGLPPAEVGTEAEIEALQQGCAAVYPSIEGIAPLKQAAAEFAKAFMDIEVEERNCVPTVGSMQASFACFMGVARMSATKNVTLFIDPGFPVHKQQLRLVGLPTASFDILHYRGAKLGPKLEEYLSQGNIASIVYSSPNNPSWICFTPDELATIARLADKYHAVVIEDLAYFGMDFRQDIGTPHAAPYQSTIAQYTQNYILLLSASKIFSYAGQRIGLIVMSNQVARMQSEHLLQYFTSSELFHFVVYGVLYATTAGAPHSAQHAFAAMLRAATAGQHHLVNALRPYEHKAKRMKELFLQHGFHLVYATDGEQPLADGFYFTVAYRNMPSNQLIAELLYYGISAIALTITGSHSKEGLRACVSGISEKQLHDLAERLQAWEHNHPKE